MSDSRGTALRTCYLLARQLLGFLTTIPLIVFALVIVAQTHFGWRSILFLVMMMAFNWALLVDASLADVNFALNDLVDFKRNFPHLELIPIPLSHYLEELRSRVPAGQAKGDDAILPGSARWQSGRLRVLVRSPEAPRLGPLPAQLVTFAHSVGAWIILKDTPDRLTNLGYFTLLHEIGHTALLSFVTRAGANTAVRYMLRPGILIALLVAPGWTSAAFLLALTVSWYAAAVANRRFLGKHARGYEEIAADSFALARCDPGWFRDYCVADLVSLLSRAEHHSRDLLESDIVQRTRAFAENLERKQEGRPLRTLRELQPGSPWATVEEILLITLLVTCGLLHAPFSLARLLIAGACALLILLSALSALFYTQLVERFSDDCLGVRPMEPGARELLERMDNTRLRIAGKLRRRPISA